MHIILFLPPYLQFHWRRSSIRDSYLRQYAKSENSGHNVPLINNGALAEDDIDGLAFDTGGILFHQYCSNLDYCEWKNTFSDL